MDLAQLAVLSMRRKAWNKLINQLTLGSLCHTCANVADLCSFHLEQCFDDDVGMNVWYCIDLTIIANKVAYIHATRFAIHSNHT